MFTPLGKSNFNHQEQLLSAVRSKHARQVAPPDEAAGLGPIYQNNTVPSPAAKKASQVKTLLELFIRGKEYAGDDADALGFRPFVYDAKSNSYEKNAQGVVSRLDFKFLSYGRTHALINNFGRGVKSLLLQSPQQQQIDAPLRLAVFSPNRPELLIAMFGGYTQRMTVVPLYATLGAEAVQFIIENSSLSAIVVSVDNFPRLINALENVDDSVKHALQHIIVMDCIENGFWGNHCEVVTDKMKAQVEALGLQLHSFQQTLDNGERATHIPLNPAQTEDLAFVMYTSGTTSQPKGAMIAHSCLPQSIAPVLDHLELPPQCNYYSYLPLAHIFEVVVMSFMLQSGARIGFSQGDPTRLTEDLQLIKPHIFCGVPRIWTRIFQTIAKTIEQFPFHKRSIAYAAYNYQLSLLRSHHPLSKIIDRKVFLPIRQKLGLENVVFLATGAAPCPPYIVEFMRIITNAWFSQGYGSTESCAVTSISPPGCALVGHCGAPVNSVQFRVSSIPEMGYLYTDKPHPRGELLISGEPIFKGYLNNPEETANSLFVDSEGKTWLRTGDVVLINSNINTISIIDRKKALIKLAQGEYVSLEKVENCYGQCTSVNQLWIYGNSFKSFLTAIVVPNVPTLYAWAVEQKLWKIDQIPKPTALTPECIQELHYLGEQYQKELRLWMMGLLRSVEHGLLGFEKIKQIHVATTYNEAGLVFHEQNHLLTPTLKLRRQPLAIHYIDVLKSLYELGNEPAQPGENFY